MTGFRPEVEFFLKTPGYRYQTEKGILLLGHKQFSVFNPPVFRYLTTPLALPEHFKKPPIFPSDEANHFKSRRSRRRPFSGCAGAWLGGCRWCSGLMSPLTLWPGRAWKAHAQDPGIILP